MVQLMPVGDNILLPRNEDFSKHLSIGIVNGLVIEDPAMEQEFAA